MKRILAAFLSMLILTLAVPAALATEEPSFSDVPISHWAFDEIEMAVDKSITNGYADGTFKPTNSVSYAHFSAFIARAFFPTEIKTYEEHNPDAAWWASSVYTLEANNILPGTKMAEAVRTSGSYDSVLNIPITRYDMAQIMYNVLKLNVTSMPAGKTSGIGDWSSVPASYRDAVSVCYALGVLNGQNDGNFGGNNYMNRAQGCVVISRLENYIENGSAGTETVTPIEPETPVENEKPVENEAPAQTTGTLANGKAITEDNVLDILSEIEKEYPTGTEWGAYTRSPTGLSGALSAVGASSSLTYGCGGFASMVSDRIFGAGGNPARKLSDNSEMRPGDAILVRDATTGKDVHWLIATSEMDSDGCFSAAEGNSNGKVSWPDKYSSLRSEETYKWANQYITVFTRYPD